MKIKCEDCGKIYDSEDVIQKHIQSLPYGDGTADEVYFEFQCPNCKGKDFEDMDECPMCGRVIPHGDFICDDCLEGEITLDDVVDTEKEAQIFAEIPSAYQEFFPLLEFELYQRFLLLSEEMQKELLKRRAESDRELFAECVWKRKRGEKP